VDAQALAQKTIDDLVDSGRETGLQVAAYLDGEPVVNACAGLADARTGVPVDERTLFNSWSTGKGTTSTVVHVLAERGLLDYDTPVAEYWPEFGAHGKAGITLAHVLTHSAGVPQAPPGITPEKLGDWHAMCARIAALRPLWEPGTATGYHALTFGYILGEVVRRVASPIHQVLREEIAGPLGLGHDLYFGVPAGQLARVATLEDGNWPAILASRPDDSLFFQAAPHAIQAGAELGNRPDYLILDVPCAGTMTARGLARMYAALVGEVDGVRLISPARTATVGAVVTAGTDRVLGAPIPKGLGYFLGLPEMGPEIGAFGCKGSGGSIAFADPANHFSFALTHNRLTGPPADNAARIAGRIRAALGIGAGVDGP
jgi:CubicO group peptidase (beta-lactamase class C family)